MWRGFNENVVAAGVMNTATLVSWDRAAGATADRFVLDWRAVYPNGPAKPPNWSRYDSVYNALVAAGVRPVLVVMNAPAWAVNPSRSLCLAAVSSCAPTPDHDADYAAFAAQVAAHYPGAAAIEVWNEENAAVNWGGSVDADHYATLLAATYRAIKQAVPSMTVLMGGLCQHAYDEHAADGRVTTMTDSAFLAAVYSAWKARYAGAVFMDGISVHPYAWRMSLDAPLQMLDRVRDVRNGFGDGTRPLYITETGVSPTLAQLTAAQAASMDAELARALVAPDVRSILFHTLVDVWGASHDGFGVLAAGGAGTFTPKAAFCALEAAHGATVTCPLPLDDQAQDARWQAQELLHAAYASALQWLASHGTFTGLTSAGLAQGNARLSATPPTMPLTPGANAHPDRIFFVPNGQKIAMCNASQADLIYCLFRAGPGGTGTAPSAAPVSYFAGSSFTSTTGTLLALNGSPGAWAR